MLDQLVFGWFLKLQLVGIVELQRLDPLCPAAEDEVVRDVLIHVLVAEFQPFNGVERETKFLN